MVGPRIGISALSLRARTVPFFKFCHRVFYSTKTQCQKNNSILSTLFTPGTEAGMATTQPVRLIEISGPPYEQGRQHGQQAAAEIRKGISHYATQVRRLKLSDADLAQIVRRYLPTIEAFEPRYVEEMRGIAQGAGVEFDHVVMLNARTEVLKLATGAEKFGHKPVGHDPAVGHDPDPDGCTTIVVEPEAAAEGRL